jgi:hypothetical protein
MSREVELDSLANYLAPGAMTRDSQHVNLAKKLYIQPEGQHHCFVHATSKFGCITFLIIPLQGRMQGKIWLDKNPQVTGLTEKKKRLAMFKYERMISLDGRYLAM